MKAKEIIAELERYINPQKREFLPYFFKTGKGQYGEGDKFLGIVVPDIKLVARKFRETSFDEIAILLNSEYHECRMCALLLLVERFKKSNESDREQIYNFYLSNTKRVNNWDLVDLSGPYIVGEYLKNRSREDLYRLAASSVLWEQRIAVVATATLIRNDDFIDIIKLSELLLHHSHDLMHKAIGWMLREMGKRNKELLLDFLEKHYNEMPRTMLRYSLEKLTSEERAYFMKR
jgi:Predicted DNA alkylation repair enzyme